MEEPHKFTCKRCEHTWVRRNWDREPKVCPKCKSAYWQEPKKREKKMYNITYKCSNCGDIFEVTNSSVPNPRPYNHICQKCGGHLWRMTRDWSKNWGNSSHCHSCGGEIHPGDFISTEVITKGDCSCLVMYHDCCLPK